MKEGSWHALARRLRQRSASNGRGETRMTVVGRRRRRKRRHQRGRHKRKPSNARLADEGWSRGTHLRRDSIRPFDAAGMEEPPLLSPLEGNSASGAVFWSTRCSRALPDVAPGERAALAMNYLRGQELTMPRPRVCRRNSAVLDDPAFAPAFTPAKPRRSRDCRRPAGAWRRRARQWPHRPAGRDEATKS